MNEEGRLQRLAQLAVEVGANVQPGQPLLIRCPVGHAALAREVARAAYRAGAVTVEASYRDRHIDRALIELGPEEALSYTSAGDLATIKDLGARHGSLIAIAGDPAPNLLSDLDPTRVGKLNAIELQTHYQALVGERQINWTIVPMPNPAWADQVF